MYLQGLNLVLQGALAHDEHLEACSVKQSDVHVDDTRLHAAARFERAVGTAALQAFQYAA